MLPKNRLSRLLPAHWLRMRHSFELDQFGLREYLGQITRHLYWQGCVGYTVECVSTFINLVQCQIRQDRRDF
jgi:hypothetical protein